MAETLLHFFVACSLIFSSSSFRVALDDFNDTCNDVTIPYPFGIGDHCSYDRYFNVTCRKADSADPFLDGALAPFLNDNLAISNISLDAGFLLVGTHVASNCYSMTGDAPNTWANVKSPKFPFFTRNRFTAVGCDTAAFLWNSETRSQSGCISVCDDESSVVDGECNGGGCCQTSNINEGLHSI